MVRFLKDERGGVSLDWVVLTALLVGTSLAVMATFSRGLDTLTMVGPYVQVRDETASASGARGTFAGRLCSGGIDAVQANEDARAAEAGVLPLDVAAYMRATYADKSALEIREELSRARDSVAGDRDWTVERTQLGAVECELVLRGLD
jgi:hypothetical protein